VETRLRTWPRRLLARPWLLAFVPINGATSGFGVALPLLILTTLHRSWTEVAVAASLFNIAVIGASFFWGYVSDHYPSRRGLLLLNYVGFAVLYALLANVQSLPLLYTLYAAVGLLSPAGASASNLLILEQFHAKERANGYASFQEMSILGSLGGLLAGYLWLQVQLPLGPLLYLLAALAAVSAAAVAIGVRDSPRPQKLLNVARHQESLASRIVHSAAFRLSFPFFPRRPPLNRGALGRFRRWVREEVHHELPLILAAMFLFNLSSNLFNISYTPYLYSVGIGAASIFLVNFANNAAQAFAYPASGNLSGRIGPDRLVQRSTYVRSLGYLAVAGFTFAPLLAGDAFGLNAVAFGVLGAAIALYSTGSSVILFRSLEGRDAGSLLGLNSALGGVAAVAGAALSGVLAVTGSFRLTFLVAGGALLISLPLWTAVNVAYLRGKLGTPGVEVTSEADPAVPARAKAD
jgi:MFS family permease